jgi:RNA polymerase sigma-70 factor, ECF subfamily
MVVVEQSERELVEACRHGEPDAFRSLFERYKDKVYSVALRYSGDPAIAQDISQDTFLKLFSAIGSFRGESGLESWLYRLVVNRCFDQKRGARRLMPLMDEFLGALRSPDTSILEDVLRTEMSAQVGSVVASLPPEQRIVIVLRYTQELSYEEIAGILGCSTGTIGSRLNRAHRVIARRLAHVAGARRRKV